MKYRVHRLEVNSDNMQEKLEEFINKLEGEIISIIPNVTQYFLMYGAKINWIAKIAGSTSSQTGEMGNHYIGSAGSAFIFRFGLCS